VSLPAKAIGPEFQILFCGEAGFMPVEASIPAVTIHDQEFS
jgi:hypothetical protein